MSLLFDDDDDDDGNYSADLNVALHRLIEWGNSWQLKLAVHKCTGHRIVAPCLSDAPANGSISGLSSGRVTTVRSGSGDALEFVALIEADFSGVRSNATGYCLCLYA